MGIASLFYFIFLFFLRYTLYNIQMHINVIVLYAQTIILLYFSSYT